MEEYVLPDSDDALLAECDVSTFRATGPGGQGVNTTDSAVRLRHRPTGITVVCRRERSQYLNKLDGLRRLRAKIVDAQRVVPERKPTKRTRASSERRLEAKRVTSQKKRRRAAPSDDD